MSSAQQLQCPDCNHLHDLGTLAGLETFNCANCGRPLKVPAALRTASAVVGVGGGAATGAVRASPAQPRQQPTATMPATPNPGRQRAMVADGAKPAKVSIWIRLLIWVVAVPIGLAVVFGAARSFGWITSNELLDTFAAKGWDRFAPIARLLPFAALLIAAMVQAAVALLERRLKVSGGGTRSATPGGGPGADRFEAGNVR